MNGCALKVCYRIRGLNLDRLVYTLHAKGIILYDVKKTDSKTLKLALSARDEQKFFAITDGMCYNIKKVSERGALYPFRLIAKNLGVFLGIAVFIAAAVFMNDVILEVDFTGSGSAYAQSIEQFLADNGVKRYARFSEFDLKDLQTRILKGSDRFSYVSAEKRGNTLRIETALSEEKPQTLNDGIFAVYSPESGTVEEIRVYRGTAVVKVGDTVKKGDLLVDGYAEIKENRVKVNVYAAVTLKVPFEYVYISDVDGAENTAEILAQERIEGKNILSCRTQIGQKDGKYVYTVFIEYTMTVYQ